MGGGAYEGLRDCGSACVDTMRYVTHYLTGLCIVRFHVQRFEPHTCVVIEGFDALEIMHLSLSSSSLLLLLRTDRLQSQRSGFGS